MFRFIEKIWPLIIILLILAVLASLFFWPAITPFLSWTVIVLGIALVVTSSVRVQVRSYRQKLITRAALWRNILVEVIGISLAIALSLLMASRAATYAGRVVGAAVEKARPGMGPVAGILAGLFAGVAIGLAIGLLVRWIWGSLTKPRRSATGEK
jgi:hypothetical protein